MIQFLHIFLIIPLLLAGCIPSSDKVEINDAYMFVTPKIFPAAAIFMTISNGTGESDRLIDFKTNRAGRAELHTMTTENDVMKMRRVEGYDLPSSEDNTVYTLSPMGNHIMVFDIVSDFTEDEEFQGLAVFENAGEVPVTVQVKSRKNINKHNH